MSIDLATGLRTRGSSNGNSNGSSESRRRRRAWLVETYRANVDVLRVEWSWGSVTEETYFINAEQLRTYESVVSVEVVPACRCYRCGHLLTAESTNPATRVTVDRIVPGCTKTAKYPKGGTYVRENIRPACNRCNSETGGGLRGAKKRGAK